MTGVRPSGGAVVTVSVPAGVAKAQQFPALPVNVAHETVPPVAPAAQSKVATVPVKPIKAHSPDGGAGAIQSARSP